MLKCESCKEPVRITGDPKDYAWKLDGNYYCCYSCYSKAFDKKYKEFKIKAEQELGYTKGRAPLV